MMLAEFRCIRRQGDCVLISVSPTGKETKRHWVSAGDAETLAAEIIAVLDEAARLNLQTISRALVSGKSA